MLCLLPRFYNSPGQRPNVGPAFQEDAGRKREPFHPRTVWPTPPGSALVPAVPAVAAKP